ncbi:MAG: GMC family oxidoreductase [Armatimonadetes bacterium]|nr:GMC family oxidoreductase [Armatimonadota bacterium]
MHYDGYADAQGFAQVGLNAPPSPSGDPGISPLPVIADAPSTAPPQVPSPSETCDIVIIGTGAGGAPLLARFAQAGLSVVALEAGKRFAPADFATDERAQSDKIFWNSERLSAGNDPVAFGNNNSGSGVGGSTLHYTAYTPRPHPDDFRLHTDTGVGADWPLSYDDLEPYLTEAEQFLGVSGIADYPWGGHRSKTYPLAPLPLNSAAQLMERGCATLGIRTAPAANAALSGRYYQPGVGWREACTNRGFCQAGCSVGAKASMDVTYIRLAEQHGAKVYPDCFATQIETDGTGRVTGVVYIREGRTHRITCRRAAFLCAGAIESPRLLLLNELGNETGQVGRNFMAHPGLQLWAQFDDVTRPNRGIPGGLISEDTHRPETATADLVKKNVNFVGGYLLQSIGVMPVTYASQLSRGVGLFGDDLLDHLRGYNHVAGINILGEGLPYPGNFMELSDEKDERGLPKPRIHHTAGDNENNLTAHADKVMRAIFAEAGAAKNVWSFQRFAHALGTCRMGTDPQTSVVNPDCRVHAMPNLYICDNSIFPSSLAVNPALTQIAVALRTADRFLAAGKRGDA